MRFIGKLLSAAAMATALTADTTASAQDDDVRITLVVKALGIGFFEVANRTAQEAAKELG